MRKIITEEEFLTLKDSIINSYNRASKLECLNLQNELLSYDLSNIPSFFYSGITFLVDDNISFTGTRANLDFKMLKFQKITDDSLGRIDAKDCQISNLFSLSSFYDKDSFSDEVVLKYPYLFLEEDLDMDVRKKIIEGKLDINDLLAMDKNTLEKYFPYVEKLGDKFLELVEKTDVHEAIFLLNANSDLVNDYLNIINNYGKDVLTSFDRESVFSFQRKYVTDNTYELSYYNKDNFSETFRNKYKKIFDGSLGYKEVIEYSKDFDEFNLTLLSYDHGLRNLSLNLGYKNLLRLLKEYEEFLDIIDDKDLGSYFLRELAFSVGSNIDVKNISNVDSIFRCAIMYTLPKLGICSTEEEYKELFSKFGFKFLDVDNVALLEKIDSNTIVINKVFNDIIGYYGLDNIKRFALENNAFSDEEASLSGNFLDYLYDEKSDFVFNYEISYQQFIKYLRERLIKRNEYIMSYEYLKGPIREELKDLFISDDAPLELKNLFYTKALSLNNLRDNTSWIPYLENTYLPCCFLEYYLFPYTFKKTFLEKASNKYGNTEILKSLAMYSSFLTDTRYSFVFIDNFDEFIDFDTYMDSSVYDFIKRKRIVYWNKAELPLEFVNRHNDIFLSDNAPLELQDLFYKRELSLDIIKSHPEYVEYLIDKDIDISLIDFNKNGSVYDTLIKYFGTSKKTFDFILLYGDRLLELDSNNYLEEIIKNSDISKVKEVIDINIRKLILEGKIVYREDDKDLLLGFGYDSIFLNADAPLELKEAFYSGKLDFRFILDNPSLIPYLEKADLRLALLNSMHYYEESIDKFYNLFGSKANKFILQKTKTIDDMFLREKIDLMYDWYLKTAGTFIPSSVVMLNFDFNEADKFFEYRKDWANLAKNTRYSSSDNFLEALLRVSYVFGVFHGDRKAMNKIKSVISSIPNTIDLNDKFNLNKVVNDILKDSSRVISDDITLPIGFYEYYKILDVMEKEGLVVDKDTSIFKQIYSDGDLSRLKISVDKYPKTTEAIRVFMESVNFDKVVSPSSLHFAFGRLEMKYDPDFRDFLLDNLCDIVNNPDYYKRLSILQKRFDVYRNTYLSGHYDLNNIFSSLGIGNYVDVDTGNIGLAQTVTITGYPEDFFKHYQYIYNYGKLRSYSSIPRVVGSKNGFTYEILKLDDPLALTVGYHTGCCQDIGEAGAWCMVHSVTNDNGRVMVVRDDENNLVAQSWVWRDKDLICFDDIEFPKTSHFASLATRKAGSVSNFADKILDVYKEAATELIRVDNETFDKLYEDKKIDNEQYKLRVSKVTVGKGFNESEAAVKRNTIKDSNPRKPPIFDKIPEVFSYKPYTDAQEQFILSDTFREEDVSSVSDLLNYSDTYQEYTDNDFINNKSLILTLCDLERETKGELSATEDILNEDNLCDTFKSYYGTRNTVKVIMNPNFAIIYDISDEGVEVHDLFFNTNIELYSNSINVEDKVSMQIGNAFKQLTSEYGNITFDTSMNEKQGQMISKSMAKSMEGEIKHATR